ncbi:MAG: DUF5105 domain-containing protein [Clostridiaceae bacterium]
MRDLRKKLMLLMSILLIPTILVACKSKVSPEESAKILFDYSVKGDSSNLSKLEASESTDDEAIKSKKEQSIKTLKSTLLARGVTANDAQLEDVYNAMAEALKKTDATTEAVSNADNKAVIKVKSTYFDMNSILTTAGAEAITPLMGSDISKPEVKAQFSEAFINSLIKELNSAEALTNTREMEFNFTVKDKVWLPEDEAKFFYSLWLLASGQKVE